MNKKKIILALVSSLMLLCSCQKVYLDDPWSIKVKVRTSDTKGTVTTTDGLMASGAFSMAAYISDDYVKRDATNQLIIDEGTGKPKLFTGGEYFSGNGNVALNSGAWSISGGPKWVSDVNTHFWAWHPVTVAGRSTPTPVSGTPVEGGEKYPYTGELSFSYTVPTVNGTTDADNAVDLLFAYSKKKFVSKQTLSTADKTINITFHHALSQVRFCVSTDDGTFDKSLKIKSITISNLKTSGNAVFSDSGDAENNSYAYDPTNDSYDQFVWTGQSGKATFGQSYNADFSTSTVTGWTKGSYTKSSKTYNLYTCQNVFFMIPQTVVKGSTDAATNMITVVFDYKGTETTKSIPITGETSSVGSSDEWKADHYYTYKLKATTVGRDIDFSVSLVGWSNRKEEIFI